MGWVPYRGRTSRRPSRRGDYGDEDRFRELFPALHRLGLRSRYLIGVPLPPELWWGYWAVHVDDIRFSPDPNPLYQRLSSLVDGTDHWVMTSNVDALFARNGFAPDRIFTPKATTAATSARPPAPRPPGTPTPLVAQLLATYDRATGAVTGPLPSCPNCGGEVEINVRIGPEFIDAPYLPAGRRLQDWLGSTAGARLLILEFGAGFNTPGVIRWPGEHLTRQIPHARLVRVNPTHPEAPVDIADRTLSVPADADHLLDALNVPQPAPDPTVAS
ncbi:NAD-dependent protein deacetylase of SIR2 family [Streptomyces sp. NBC_00989]|uniref:NAD-dependent protein deacetylase of SIR2 family n=1 Tax=Streptomyces sp. NBC_00989 TaxID=2903705 RepID=UPI003865B847|nr:NAD-dependent protein deacetylase of SIR2 family [Streptomyces sp. NBC_00989]